MNTRSNDDSGLWALQALLRLRSVTTTVDELRHHVGQDAVGIGEMQRCAKAYGFAARFRRTNWDDLAALPLPGIVGLQDGRFLLLGKVNHEKALVLAAGAERSTVITRTEFEALWDGRLILLGPAGALTS